MQRDSREALLSLIYTIHETATEKGWWPSDKMVRAQRYEPECTLAMLAYNTTRDHRHGDKAI